MKSCIRSFLLSLLLLLCLSIPMAAGEDYTLIGAPDMGSGAVSLSPAEDGWLFGAAPGLDGSEQAIEQWFTPADGKVVLTGLNPAEPYRLYRRQSCENEEGTQASPEAVLSFVAPVAPPASDQYRRLAENILPYRDKIEIYITDPGLSFQLTGSSALPDESGWQSAGDALVFSDLDPHTSYRLWVIPFTFYDAYHVPNAVDIAVLTDIIPQSQTEGSVGSDGSGVITISTTRPELFYTVLSPDDAQAVVGVPAAPVQKGTGGALEFSGLLPGGRYFPIALEAPPEQETLPARNAAIQLPVCDDSGLGLYWSRDDAGQMALTLSPAFSGVCYALCSADGVPLVGLDAIDGQGNALSSTDGWFQSPDGLLRFTGLPDGAQQMLLTACSQDRTVFSAKGYPLSLPLDDALPEQEEILLSGAQLTLPAAAGVQYELVRTDDGSKVQPQFKDGLFVFDALHYEVEYTLYARPDGALPVMLYSFTIPSTPEVPDPQPPVPEPEPQPDNPYIPPSPSREDDVKGSDLSEENSPSEPLPVPVDGVSDMLVCDERIAYLWGDPQGRCLPDKPITRAEAAAIFYRLLRHRPESPPAAFLDVPSGAWYAEAVNALASLNIVQGVGGGLYLPDAPITRGELALLASRLCRSVSVQAAFSDLQEGDWAYDAAAAVCHYGLMEADAQGAFLPDNHVLRAEAVRIVNRMLGRQPDPGSIGESGRRFVDLPIESAYYDELMEAANGILPISPGPPSD